MALALQNILLISIAYKWQHGQDLCLSIFCMGMNSGLPDVGNSNTTTGIIVTY